MSFCFPSKVTTLGSHCTWKQKVVLDTTITKKKSLPREKNLENCLCSLGRERILLKMSVSVHFVYEHILPVKWVQIKVCMLHLPTTTWPKMINDSRCQQKHLLSTKAPATPQVPGTQLATMSRRCLPPSQPLPHHLS